MLKLHPYASATSLKTVRDAAIIRGEISRLNNYKPFRKKNYAYTFQTTKNYICSIALSFNHIESLFLNMR